MTWRASLQAILVVAAGSRVTQPRVRLAGLPVALWYMVQGCPRRRDRAAWQVCCFSRVMGDFPAIDPGLIKIDPPKPATSAAPTAAPHPRVRLRDTAMIQPRRQQPIGVPLPRTLKWIASLPQEVKPLALLRRYPRIANVLALTWSEPDSVLAYMGELLLDRRGNRQGFPKAIRQELLALREFREPAAPALSWDGRYRYRKRA